MYHPCVHHTDQGNRGFEFQELWTYYKFPPPFILGGADLLRSKSVRGIHKEVTARICALNIVRIIMLQAAAGGVDIMRISFTRTVRAIIGFASALALRATGQLPVIYEAMLKEIASYRVPERPGRLEPRKVTHDERAYPKLKTSRAQWRK